MEKKLTIPLTKEILFAIAKIIDNDFLGSEDTFTCQRINGYNFLSTEKCDGSSFIKVYHDFNVIEKIEVLGNYTHSGWQLIHPTTMRNVVMYLNTLTPN